MSNYTYTELCKKPPHEIVRLRDELKDEYAGLLQEHHNNCAAVLFYQCRIKEVKANQG